MLSRGKIFDERLHASDPGTGYGDTSREHHVCTATALDYTLVNGVYVPTYNGTSSTVNCGAGFNTVTDFTMSFWFNADDVTTEQRLFTKFASTSDNWGLQITGSNVRISDDIDNVGQARYPQTISINTWYHIVVSMDSLENKLYLDGVLVGSGESSSGDWSSYGGNLYLGQLGNGFTWFNGMIWNNELISYIPDTPAGFAIEKYNEHAGIFGKSLI
jgi:hypothetical protein